MHFDPGHIRFLEPLFFGCDRVLTRGQVKYAVHSVRARLHGLFETGVYILDRDARVRNGRGRRVGYDTTDRAAILGESATSQQQNSNRESALDRHELLPILGRVTPPSGEPWSRIEKGAPL